MKIAITGMGIISAVGMTVEENFNALKNRHSGISDLENIDTVRKGVWEFGEIKFTNSDLADILHLPENHNFSRTTLLGAYAAQKAVETAGIKNINEYPSGLVSSTGGGGMDKTAQYFCEYF